MYKDTRQTQPGAISQGQRAEVEAGVARMVVYEQFETFARQSVQQFLQQLLEEEVNDLLGRRKSDRREADSVPGYRNGHGEPRQLTTSLGTVTVRRPRVRDTEGRFESRVLPLFQKRTKEVSETLPTLYLHGLAAGDFELALRGLLGDDAPLSASTIARLRAGWLAEYTAWKQEPLDGANVVYLWVDGIYVKAGLEKDKAALLVAIAGCADGTKRVMAVESGHRESEASWSTVLRDLKRRGMAAPRLVIGDGHLGIWSALASVFPECGEQRCWNHKLRNVLDCIGQKKQADAKSLLTKIMYADTRKEAETNKRVFQVWARAHQYEKAAASLDQDWDRLVSYYAFPKEHWLHLRTTNIIESPFASVRLRTDASKRYKKVDGATAMIWKLLMVAQSTFRKLNSPDLLAQVYASKAFVDGIACAATGDDDSIEIAAAQQPLTSPTPPPLDRPLPRPLLPSRQQPGPQKQPMLAAV